MRDAILNAMRLQARRATAHKTISRYGTVTSYDPNKYSAKVLIQPEGIATGFLPVAAPWAGNGWGFFAPPSAGDQVVVVFIDGEITAGHVLQPCFNTSVQPLSVPSGELWIVHKNGQFAKFTNDGKLTFGDGHGASLEFDGSGNLVTAANNWTHTGTVTFQDDVTFSKDVTVDQTLTATMDVVGGNVSLKTHLTSAVQVGTGISGLPVPL
jgi:phage baseplate assembly protein V